MKIIDKAVWQIDGGVLETLVEKHFQLVFQWLNQHDFLSEEGKEEYEDGIDTCASLNEDLVTSEGLIFLEECYDNFLKEIEIKSIYGSDLETEIIEEYYKKYLNSK